MKKKYLSTPKGFTWKKAAIVANGCGTEGWKGWIVPETFYGLRISDACNIHDYEYNYGLTLKDKDRADNRFLKNFYLIIKNEVKWTKFLNPLRRSRARKYYKAVVLLGESAFLEGKEGVKLTERQRIAKALVT